MDLRAEINAFLSYCHAHSRIEYPLLTELERQTHLKTVSPQMLCGPVMGNFLSFMSRIVQPEIVLEIGTFTGYSALCLAKGLLPNGHLYTIEANPEFGYIFHEFIRRSEYASQITLISEKAEHVIPDLAYEFDLVFIDAGKRNNQLHFSLVYDKLRPGGLIIIDNVLWGGSVYSSGKSRQTKSVGDFNSFIAQDTSLSSVFLPIRDGVVLIRKISS